jgi:CDP-diacylglycerol--glycerol-3-phosphate 3-phosphatidyltransferase
MFELNLPNVLTVVRILLVPVLVAALLSATGSGDLLAAVVFVVASVTDALDGWIARRRKSESTFGKLMDPLADKLLVVAALVSLVSLDRLSAWVAMVIIAREFAVTGLRQLAMEEGHVIPASIWGKLKTVTQIAMVLVLIAVDDRTVWVDALIYVTVFVTVASCTSSTSGPSCAHAGLMNHKPDLDERPMEMPESCTTDRVSRATKRPWSSPSSISRSSVR